MPAGTPWTCCLLLFSLTTLVSTPTTARGELQWELSKPEPMRFRIVALARNHLRSSYFANEEIFIAEKELTKDESRLVKLVYGFLPYQPRLSETGLDYETVHELKAARDPECDQTLAEITTGKLGDWRQDDSQLKYSKAAPTLNLARNKSRLPCYVTNANEYTKPLHEPPNQ
jgi:hypothetical protein